MVVRIHNVGKWAVLQPGAMLELKGLGKRRVRLEVNCPAPTRFDLVEAEEGKFLAVVQGHEVIEFVAGEDACVVPTSEDEVWYFTNDGDDIAAVYEAVSFTKIANRRTRNPQLELMMFKQQQNIERRIAAMQAELEAMVEARAAEPHDPDTGEIEDDEVGDGVPDGDQGEASGEQSEPAAAPAEGQGASARTKSRVPAGPATA